MNTFVLCQKTTDKPSIGELWAVTELKNALTEKGASIVEKDHIPFKEQSTMIVLGKSSDYTVQHAARICGIDLLFAPESIMIASTKVQNGQTIVLVAGADCTGFIYACLEFKEIVDAMNIDDIINIDNRFQSPDTKIRGVSRYVVNTGDNEWLYSEEFWHYMYKRMSLSHLNRIEIVVGFDTAYLSPPYPWYINVEGFELLRPTGLDEKSRAKNLSSLRQVGQLAHEYGITFSYAPWQQKPWTSQQEQMIEHMPVDDDELIQYTKKAVTQFLNECPEIDVFQLRVNHEAGVGSYQSTYENYWLTIIDSIAIARPVKLEMRAKGLTDTMIEYANNCGLDVTVPTKYWCEHIAMPHHMTKMRTEELTRLHNVNHSRRYSYADMLKKPRYYDLLYRLWNYGTCKILTWGDWDYAKRFAQSCKMGDANGFVITAPLALLGGMQNLNQSPIKSIKDQTTLNSQYEDERYLPWYYCFGRAGYSINQDSTAWKRMLENQYDTVNGETIQNAFHYASYILPLICTFHMPVHPSLNYSIEIDTGGALFPENNYNKAFRSMGYLNAEPSDPQMFYGIDEYVSCLLKNEPLKKYTPLQAANWLESFADYLQKECSRLNLQDTGRNRLLLNDFSILAQMAKYHARKTEAAIHLSLYNSTSETKYAAISLNRMIIANNHWQKLSEFGDVYTDDMCFQLGDSGNNSLRGHWRDRIIEIEKDIAQLHFITEKSDEKDEGLEYITSLEYIASLVPEKIAAKIHAPLTAKAGEILTVTLEVNNEIDGQAILHYRHQNLLEGAFLEIEMQKIGDLYEADIPADYVNSDFNILVFASINQGKTATTIVPGFWSDAEAMPYCEIKTV